MREWGRRGQLLEQGPGGLSYHRSSHDGIYWLPVHVISIIIQTAEMEVTAVVIERRFVKETRLIYRVSGYSMAKAAKEMEGTVLINERAANDMTTSSDSKTDKQASALSLATGIRILTSSSTCTQSST